MSDDETKVGEPESGRVRANEPGEVDQLVEKFGLSRQVVEQVVQHVGPARARIEEQLEGIAAAR